MTDYIGIDPGVTGAIAWLHKRHDGFDIEIFDMPLQTKIIGKKARHEIDAFEMTRIIQSFGGSPICIIEKVHSMPRQGVVSSFGFGASYGMAVGVAAASRLPIHLVSPNKWKRALGLTSEKSESIALAKQLYPQSTEFLTRKKDDGRAEALLLAHWGMKNCL